MDLTPGNAVNPQAVAAELEAMSALAKTLSSLPEETRVRVLRWANDYFHGAPNIALPVPETVTNPTLVLGNAEELFGSVGPRTDESLSLEDATPTVVPDHVDVPPEATDSQSSEPGGVDLESLIQTLAADFQRLANAWQVTEADA